MAAPSTFENSASLPPMLATKASIPVSRQASCSAFSAQASSLFFRNSSN
jgi:hypothetical protein